MIFIPLTQILQYLLEKSYPSLHNTVDGHLFQAVFDSHQHILSCLFSCLKKKKIDVLLNYDYVPCVEQFYSYM